jgi:ferredoxin
VPLCLPDRADLWLSGVAAPVRIVYDADACLHEGKCRQVCLVPHVLDMTKLGYGTEVRARRSGRTARAARMCLDACPTGALTFEIAGITRPPPIRPAAGRGQAREVPGEPAPVPPA